MSMAVMTVVYPAAIPYLSDFAMSVRAQTDKDFTLCIGNDGIREPLLRHYFPDAVVIPVAGTIAATRKQMIRHIRDCGFESVVFADCDDIMGTTRVAVARDYLQDFAFVVTDLIPFGEPGMGILSENLNLDLMDQNCAGLGNTAARVGLIAKASDAVSDRVEAFDWALFTRVAMRHIWQFTTEAATHYRQTHSTTARNVARLKRLHYEDLKDLNLPEIDKRAAYFAKAERSGAAQVGGSGYWWKDPVYKDEADCPP